MYTPRADDLAGAALRLAFVPGVPASQGSKNSAVRGRRAVMWEADKKLPGWRGAVKAAASEALIAEADWDSAGAAYMLGVSFLFSRPQRPRHPHWHAVKPDLDKIVRAVGDALTQAGVWEDDARAAILLVEKRYVDDQHPNPGALIVVHALA